MDRAILQAMGIDELRRLVSERGIGATDELERDQLVTILVAHGAPSSTSAKPRPTSGTAHHPTGGPAGPPPAPPSGLDVPSSTLPARPVENDPEAMAGHYLQQGLPERAAEIYRQLIVKSPHDPEVARLLAAAEDAILAKAHPPARPADARSGPHTGDGRILPTASRIEPAPGEPFGMLDFEEPPDGYGVDECELIARDPFHLFTYWEVTERGLADARGHLADQADGAKLILRMFTTTATVENGTTRDTRDHELGSHRGRRYLPSPRPGALVRAAIGLVARSGLFAPIANSSTARIPPAEPAPPTAPEWIEVVPVRRGALDLDPIQVIRSPETALHGERGLPGESLPGGAPSSPPESGPAVGESPTGPGSWRWRPGSQS